MAQSSRAEWAEIRQESDECTLLVYFIGDLTPHGWEFYEREACELRWYPVVTTAELIKKAMAELSHVDFFGETSMRSLKQVA